MNQEINRRDFLGPTAGLSLAVTLCPDCLAFSGEAAADAAFAPSVWLTIATNGTISIVSPAAEMGQGSFTTLPLIIRRRLGDGQADPAADVGRQEICANTR